MGGPIPGAVGDPLPGPPVTENDWQSIKDGHQLIYLGLEQILDWVPATGDYRVWAIDRSAVDNQDPFQAAVLSQGTFVTIGSGERIVFLGDERVLVWTPSTRRFRVWIIDRAARGAVNPLPDAPQTDGIWASIDSFHELIALGGRRVLDWDKGAGTFRTWNHDPTAVGAADPFPGPPAAQGPLAVASADRLIPVGNDRVLQWTPASGAFKVWRYERNATGAAFFGDPEVVGQWTGIRTGHELVYLDQDRMLDWQPASGHFQVWRYDRAVTTLRRATVRVHLRILSDTTFVTMDDQVAALTSLYASYGIQVVVASRTKVLPVGDEARFQNLMVGECKRSNPPTPEQLDLFNHFRDGVDPDEIVVYYIRQTYPSVNGCARSPADKPSAVVAGTWITVWTLAHEVGHVLGLDHIDDDANRLMFPSTGSVKNLPPDLVAAEIDTILASNLAKS